MKLWLSLLAVLGGALLLASCATLSREQCEAGDWRAVGFGDGTRGRPAEFVANHVDACAEHGISLDRALYDAGRREGLAVYCRLSTAESEGRDGERYYNVCTGELGIAFARVHAAAERVHEASVELDGVESEIRSLIGRLGRGGLSDEEAARLASELRSLQLERSRLELRLRSAEQNLSAVRRAEEARLRQAGIPH